MIIPRGFFDTPDQSGGAGGELITLSPTQAFIKNYFTPDMLQQPANAELEEVAVIAGALLFPKKQTASIPTDSSVKKSQWKTNRLQ